MAAFILALYIVMVYAQIVVGFWVLLTPEATLPDAIGSLKSIGDYALFLIGPVTSIIAILCAKKLKQKIVAWLQFLQKHLKITGIVALLLSVGLCSVIYYLGRSGPYSTVRLVSKEGPRWQLATYQEQLQSFDDGSLLKDRDTDLLDAFVFSYAARNEASESFPDREKLFVRYSRPYNRLTVRIAAHIGLANLHIALRDAQQVISHLKAAEGLARNTHHPLLRTVLMTRGRNFINLQQTENDKGIQKDFLELALKDYNELIESSTEDLDDIITNRATVHFLLGKYTEAINDWRKVILRQSDASNETRSLLGTLHCNIGVGCLFTEQWQEAVLELEQAVSYGGQDLRKFQLNLIIALVRTGRRVEAARIIDVLKATTRSIEDWALFGWAYSDRRSLPMYAQALNVRSIRNLTEEQIKEIHRILTTRNLGLKWDLNEIRPKE